MGGSLVGPLAGSAHATTLPPTCQSTQITVTTGATLSNLRYDQTSSRGTTKATATEAVPVYFHNSGATCRLLSGAPTFRAVRRTTNVAKLSAGDLALPVHASSMKRVTIAADTKVEAYYIVVKPTTLPSRLCHPDATTGFEVTSFAKSSTHTTFITRKLRFVCFDSGTRSMVINDGVVWVNTP